MFKLYSNAPKHDPNSDRWFIDYQDEMGYVFIRVYCFTWEDCHKKINSHWRPLLTPRKMTPEARRIYDWIYYNDDPHWARDIKTAFEHGDSEMLKEWKRLYIGRLAAPGRDTESDYYRELIKSLELPEYKEQLSLPLF